MKKQNNVIHVTSKNPICDIENDDITGKCTDRKSQRHEHRTKYNDCIVTNPLKYVG